MVVGTGTTAAPTAGQQQGVGRGSTVCSALMGAVKRFGPAVITQETKNMSKQGIEKKWGDRSNVLKTIVKQGIEGILVYCANGTMGVSSSMSKTRSKKGSE